MKKYFSFSRPLCVIKSSNKLVQLNKEKIKNILISNYDDVDDIDGIISKNNTVHFKYSKSSEISDIEVNIYGKN